MDNNKRKCEETKNGEDCECCKFKLMKRPNFRNRKESAIKNKETKRLQNQINLLESEIEDAIRELFMQTNNL